VKFIIPFAFILSLHQVGIADNRCSWYANAPAKAEVVRTERYQDSYGNLVQREQIRNTSVAEARAALRSASIPDLVRSGGTKNVHAVEVSRDSGGNSRAFGGLSPLPPVFPMSKTVTANGEIVLAAGPAGTFGSSGSRVSQAPNGDTYVEEVIPRNSGYAFGLANNYHLDTVRLGKAAADGVNRNRGYK
jgi:hypothetical protein